MGFAFGILGLLLVGAAGGAWGPCSSLSVVIGRLTSAPLYSHWLGIHCDRLLGVPKALLVEWVPIAVILALAGALAARLGPDASRLRGAMTSGVLAALTFSLFSLDRSAWFYGSPNVPRAIGIGVGALVCGLLLGYIGVICTERPSPTDARQRGVER
jgi:hypothetical protein